MTFFAPNRRHSPRSRRGRGRDRGWNRRREIEGRKRGARRRSRSGTARLYRAITVGKSFLAGRMPRTGSLIPRLFARARKIKYALSSFVKIDHELTSSQVRSLPPVQPVPPPERSLRMGTFLLPRVRLLPPPSLPLRPLNPPSQNASPFQGSPVLSVALPRRQRNLLAPLANPFPHATAARSARSTAGRAGDVIGGERREG